MGVSVRSQITGSTVGAFYRASFVYGYGVNNVSFSESIDFPLGTERISFQPRQAPALTTRVRTHIQLIAPNATGSTMQAWEAVTVISSSKALVEDTTFYAGARWQNMLGKSFSLKTARGNELDGVVDTPQVGTLSAVMNDPAFDPTKNARVRPGRKVRVTYLSDGIWSTLWSGTLSTVDVNYSDNKPRVTLQATDTWAQVNNFKVPEAFNGSLEQRGNAVAAKTPGIDYTFFSNPGTDPSVTTPVMIDVQENATATEQLTWISIAKNAFLICRTNGNIQMQSYDTWGSSPSVLLSDRPYDGVERVIDQGMLDASLYVSGKRWSNATGWNYVTAGTGAKASRFDFATGRLTAYFDMLPVNSAQSAPQADKDQWLKVDGGDVYTLKYTAYQTGTRHKPYLNYVKSDGSVGSVDSPWITSAGSSTTVYTANFIIPADVVAIAPRWQAEGLDGQTFTLYGKHPAGSDWSFGQSIGDVDYYTDIDTNFGSQALFNEFMVNRHNLDEEDGEKTYGPYTNAASKSQWGSKSTTIDVNDGVPREIAERYAKVYANPEIFASQVKFNARQSMGSQAMWNLYGVAKVKHTDSGLNASYRILNIEHEITPESWEVTVGFRPLEATAAVTITNPPGGASAGPGDLVQPTPGQHSRRYRNTTFNVANNTTTTVPYNVIDTEDGITYDATNNRWVVAKDGRYVVSASVSYSPNATGARIIDINLNGSVKARGRIIGWTSTNNIVGAATVLKCVAGDVIAITTLHNQGAALALAANGAENFASVTFVGA